MAMNESDSWREASVVVSREGMFAVHEHGSSFLQVDVELMVEGVPGHAVDGRDGMRAYSAVAALPARRR